MKNNYNLYRLAFIVSIFFSIQTFSQISNDGLIAYYPFNGNANDESGNSNNGVVNGATLVDDRFGLSNSAYSFNGTNNFIEVPDSESLKNLTEISISAWVNINNWYTSSGNFFPVIHKSDQVIHGMYALTLRDIGGISHLKTEENGFSYSWNFNQWYHIVSVFSNSTNKVYINGILIQDVATGVFPNSFNSDLPLIIGMDRPGFLEYSNGKIDDIGIWNRALTVEEIDNLYNQGICYQTVTVTDTLIIDVTTLSYNPITYLNTFTVYPNPAKDKINIDNGDINSVPGYKVEIKNSLAQSMFYSEVNQQLFTIDISAWSTGLYFIYIYDDMDHIIEIKKIILE